ncbi:MAG TPA: hypothetical protein VJ870_05065 [Amycolatopsis sp.]|nr:hypothetical protein [Amycolatopsis sp.]
MPSRRILTTGALLLLFVSGGPAATAAVPAPAASCPATVDGQPGTGLTDTVSQLNQIPVLGTVTQPLASAVPGALDTLCGALAPSAAPGTPSATTPPTSTTRPAVPAEPTGTGASATFGASAPAPGSGGVVFGSPVPSGELLPLAVDGVPGAAATGTAAPVVNSLPLAVVSVPQPTGSAVALPQRRSDVPVPALAAVLALSLVSAFLVRRWVLGGRA